MELVTAIVFLEVLKSGETGADLDWEVVEAGNSLVGFGRGQDCVGYLNSGIGHVSASGLNAGRSGGLVMISGSGERDFLRWCV